MLAVGTLLMAAIAPFSGRLADRLRPHAIAAAGVAVVLVAALLATRLGAGSSLALIGLVLAVQGMGFAFFSSANMTMVMNAVPPERSGIASALSAGSRSLGMVSGMLIAGALVSLHLGHDAVGADSARFVTAMHTAFWSLAALTALALPFSFNRVRSRG